MFRSLATAASKSSRTGYPWWHGSQQAVDATIVNPVTRVGRLAQTCIPGGLPKRPLDAKATGQTYPELVRRRWLPLGGGWCSGSRPVWSEGCQLAPDARLATCFGHTGCHASGCACSLGCPLVGATSCRCAAHHRGISVGASARR